MTCWYCGKVNLNLNIVTPKRSNRSGIFPTNTVAERVGDAQLHCVRVFAFIVRRVYQQTYVDTYSGMACANSTPVRHRIPQQTCSRNEFFFLHRVQVSGIQNTH